MIKRYFASLSLIFPDHIFIDTIFRDGGKWTLDLPKVDNLYPELEILVEGMRRINFGQYMLDREGVTNPATLNGMT